MATADRRRTGTRGEDAAVRHLKEKGYRILARNFRFERAEVDIVAEDNGVLVFVEVKTRGPNALGDPEDAVTATKCEQLTTAAEGYLYINKLDGRECRFDVVAVRVNGPAVAVRHIEDAF
jgi:putative endonuclease